MEIIEKMARQMGTVATLMDRYIKVVDNRYAYIHAFILMDRSKNISSDV